MLYVSYYYIVVLEVADIGKTFLIEIMFFHETNKNSEGGEECLVFGLVLLYLFVVVFAWKKGTSLNSGLQQSIDPACRQPDIDW